MNSNTLFFKKGILLFIFLVSFFFINLCSTIAATGDQVDLGVTITGPNSANNGDNFSYIVTVSNVGPDAVSGAILNYTLFDDALNVQAICTSSTALGGTSCPALPTNLDPYQATTTVHSSSIFESPSYTGGNIVSNKQILAELPYMPVNSTIIIQVIGQFPMKPSLSSVQNIIEVQVPNDGTVDVNNTTNTANMNTNIYTVPSDPMIYSFTQTTAGDPLSYGKLPHTTSIDSTTQETYIDYTDNPTPITLEVTYKNNAAGNAHGASIGMTHYSGRETDYVSAPQNYRGMNLYYTGFSISCTATGGAICPTDFNSSFKETASGGMMRYVNFSSLSFFYRDSYGEGAPGIPYFPGHSSITITVTFTPVKLVKSEGNFCIGNPAHPSWDFTETLEIAINKNNRIRSDQNTNNNERLGDRYIDFGNVTCPSTDLEVLDVVSSSGILLYTGSSEGPLVSSGSDPYTVSMMYRNNGPHDADGATMEFTPYLYGGHENNLTYDVEYSGLEVTCTATGGAVCPSLAHIDANGSFRPQYPSRYPSRHPPLFDATIPKLPSNSSIILTVRFIPGGISTLYCSSYQSTSSTSSILDVRLNGHISPPNTIQESNFGNNSKTTDNIIGNTFPVTSLYEVFCGAVDFAVTYYNQSFSGVLDAIQVTDTGSFQSYQDYSHNPTPIKFTVKYTNLGDDYIGTGSNASVPMQATINKGKRSYSAYKIHYKDVSITCTATGGVVCPTDISSGLLNSSYTGGVGVARFYWLNLLHTRISNFPSRAELTFDIEFTPLKITADYTQCGNWYLNLVSRYNGQYNTYIHEDRIWKDVGNTELSIKHPQDINIVNNDTWRYANISSITPGNLGTIDFGYVRGLPCESSNIETTISHQPQEYASFDNLQSFSITHTNHSSRTLYNANVRGYASHNREKNQQYKDYQITCTASGGAICPSQSDFFSGYSSQNRIQSLTGSFSEYDSTNDGFYDTSVPQMPPNSSVTFTIQYRSVNPHDGSSSFCPLMNGKLWSTTLHGYMDNHGNNDQTRTTHEAVSQEYDKLYCADIYVNNTINPGVVGPNESASIDIVVGNSGPAHSSGVYLESIIPFGFSGFSLSSVGCSTNDGSICTSPNFDSNTRVFSASIPNIPKNTIFTYTLSGVAIDYSSTWYMNTRANMTSESHIEGVRSTNSALTNLSIQGIDPSIQKSIDTHTGYADQIVTYTILATNPPNGSVFTEASIDDLLPDTLEYIETQSIRLSNGVTQTTNNYDTSDPSKLFEPQTTLSGSYTKLSWGEYQFPSGGSVTIVFKAKIKRNISCDKQRIYNTAVLNYTNTLSQRSKRVYDGSLPGLIRDNLFVPVCSSGNNNPPILTVTPPNPDTVPLGFTYSDPGATAHDPEDGNITSQIVSIGSVDTTQTGSYSINYSVTDSDGNRATGIRTVNVVPRERLSIRKEGYSGANPDQGSRYTLYIDNDTNTDFTNVLIQDLLPKELVYTGVTEIGGRIRTTSIRLYGGATVADSTYNPTDGSGNIHPQILSEPHSGGSQVLSWGRYSIPKGGSMRIYFYVALKEPSLCGDEYIDNSARVVYSFPNGITDTVLFDGTLTTRENKRFRCPQIYAGTNRITIGTEDQGLAMVPYHNLLRNGHIRNRYYPNDREYLRPKYSIPGTVSEDTYEDYGEEVFDKNVYSYWHNEDTIPISLSYQFSGSVQKVINQYSLYRGPVFGENSDKDSPKDWTFEGSNDGNNWDILDTQQDQVIKINDPKKVYTFANTTAYQRYRIRFSAAHNTDNTITLSEMILGDGIPDTQIISSDLPITTPTLYNYYYPGANPYVSSDRTRYSPPFSTGGAYIPRDDATGSGLVKHLYSPVLTGASLSQDGILYIPEYTASGKYQLAYSICQDILPGNCSIAQVSVTVKRGTNPPIPASAPITATDDTLIFTGGTSTGNTISILINDTFSGSQATTINTTFSLTGVLAITGATLDTTTGIYSVPTTTKTGTYTQQYQLCETNNTTNCSAANITVIVNAPTPAPITLCDDPTATNYNSATGSHVTVDNTTCTYILSFDANSGIGTMVDEVHTGATNITLTANTFTKTGYTFNGWNTQSDGSGTGYSDGSAFTLPNSNTTLYAQWAPAPAPITICDDPTATNYSNATGSHVTVDNSTCIYPTSTPITATDDTLTFTGGTSTGNTINILLNDTFSGSQAHSGNTILSLTGGLTITGATLNAANGIYTVPTTTNTGTYTQLYQLCEAADPNNCSAATVKITVNEAPVVPTPIPVCKDPNATNYDNTTTNTVEDNTLCTYPTPITICDDTNATNYNNSTGSHVTVDNTICTYILTYNPNTGTGTMPDETHTGATSITLTTNIFTKTGHAFNGWNTTNDGTGSGYTDTDSFTIPNTNTTLYAQWTIISTPITICDDTNATNYNNSTGSHITVDNSTCTYPTPTPITICNDPTATNYNSATGSHVTVDNSTCTYKEKACKNQNATNYDPDPNKGIDNSLCKYKETTSTTGPGGCGTSCGDHPVVPPFTGSLLNPPSDPEDPEFNARCEALITNLDELKAKTLYYKTFINNTTKQYTDKAITWGQFKRTLEKYEGLLKNTETISDALQKINKNMNETVERDIAIKILISSLQERYKDDTNFPILPNKNYITSFNDIQPTTLYAPEIQQSYNLCLTHGRNTKDGVPLNQTTGQKDPNAPRLFEPRAGITIAETIKVLINMSHSWDNIPGLTGTAKHTGIPLLGKSIEDRG